MFREAKYGPLHALALYSRSNRFAVDTAKLPGPKFLRDQMTLEGVYGPYSILVFYLGYGKWLQFCGSLKLLAKVLPTQCVHVAIYGIYLGLQVLPMSLLLGLCMWYIPGPSSTSYVLAFGPMYVLYRYTAKLFAKVP